MTWMQFLNLLEGAPVNISVPKNHFSEDVVWTQMTPIFATAAAPITRIVGNAIDEVQTKMMRNIWKMYHFKHEFTEENIIRFPNCGKCFAELVLEN